MASKDAKDQADEAASPWHIEPPTLAEQRAYRWWWIHYPSGTVSVVDAQYLDLAASHRGATGQPPPLGYAPCMCPPMPARVRDRRPRDAAVPDTAAQG